MESTFRKVKPSDFKCKTIKSVNTRAANVLKFTFTDGTSVQVWSEPTSLGLAVIGIYDLEDAKVNK